MTKSCSKCGEIKSVNGFTKQSSKRDGLRAECKSCQREYYLANRETVLARSKAYREAHPELAEYWKAYYVSNKNTVRARQKTYYKNNQHKFLAYSKKRKTQTLQALPAWQSPVELEAYYYMATKFLEGYHVDHDIPLQGKLACGLHVLENLRLLPASENISKHNKFQPYSIDRFGNITYLT